MDFYKKIKRILQIFILRRFKIGLLNYRNNVLINNSELITFLLEIKKDTETLQSLEELCNIYSLSKQTNHLNGDIAEVGVYRGGSAKIIATNKGKRNLHLFDSFEGVLNVSENIDLHKQGDFQNVSLERVKNYLAEFNNLFFYKGWFPAVKPIKNEKFSFVHLDVDLYQSTLDALIFFYNRMLKEGVILSHDYNSISCPGVRKAFDEFFRNKEEFIIELGGTSQCLIVKS